MNRLFLLVALLAAPAALAQQTGGHHDHAPAGHAEAAHADHDALLALHMRMMADSTVHARMRADAAFQALMAEIHPPMDHGGMDHGGMDHGQMDHEAMGHEGMDHGQMEPGAMMDRMRERMGAMPDAEHAAFMARFEAAHRQLLRDPEVHARLMADPEARRLMGPLMEDMDHGDMDHDGMDHGEGKHDGMDHGQMEHGRMDHGGADHAAGVAMQRRNAGAVRIGDERPATPTVGEPEFDASATADRFHAALAAGDRPAVEALLTPDAVVLEGGRAEARNEYLGGHFARDAAFLADAQPEPLFRRTTVAGDAAWVASTQRVRDAEMAELLVMKRTAEGWRVAAVHWSSAR